MKKTEIFVYYRYYTRTDGTERWSCWTYKGSDLGDYIYLNKQGKLSKGLFYFNSKRFAIATIKKYFPNHKILSSDVWIGTHERYN
jgi:hypothetical protein